MKKINFKKNKGVILSLSVLIALVGIFVPISLVVSKNSRNQDTVVASGGFDFFEARTTTLVVDFGLDGIPTNPTYSIVDRSTDVEVKNGAFVSGKNKISGLTKNTDYILSYNWDENQTVALERTFSTRENSSYYITDISVKGSKYVELEYQLDLSSGDVRPGNFWWSLHEGVAPPSSDELYTGTVVPLLADVSDHDDIGTFIIGPNSDELIPNTSYTLKTKHTENTSIINSEFAFTTADSTSAIPPVITLTPPTLPQSETTAEVQVEIRWNDFYFDAINSEIPDLNVQYKFVNPNQPADYENWRQAKKNMSNPTSGEDWKGPNLGEIYQNETLYFSPENSPLGVGYAANLHLRIYSEEELINYTNSTSWTQASGENNHNILNDSANEAWTQENTEIDSIQFKFEIQWNSVSQETPLHFRYKEESDSTWEPSIRIPPNPEYTASSVEYFQLIPNLKSDTFYNIEVYDSNNIANTLVNYRIKTEPIPAELLNVSVANVTNTTVSINYSLILNDGFDRMVYRYKAKTDPQYGREFWVDAVTDGTTSSFEIDNLIPGTDYDIQVWLAHNRDSHDDIIIDGSLFNLSAKTSGSVPEVPGVPFILYNSEVDRSTQDPSNANITIHYNYEEWGGDYNEIRYVTNSNEEQDGETWDVIKQPTVGEDGSVTFIVDDLNTYWANNFVVLYINGIYERIGIS